MLTSRQKAGSIINMRRIIKQEDKENVDSYASELTSLKIDKSGNAKVTLQPLGGIIIVE